jgi:sortase A
MLNVLRSRKLELSMLCIGAALLASYGALRLHSRIGSRIALDSVMSAHTATTGTTPVDHKPKGVSFALWSEKRVTAYEESLAHQFGPVLGVLVIPRIGLKVPVFNGTDDLTLNRGVGRIIGTAQTGSNGNLGIAGHRDGFFRGLKDVRPGDDVDLQTVTDVFSYRVSDIEIVKPDDTKVLDDRTQPALTLVTCYPFYFAGAAPQRYIVHCSLRARNPTRHSGG